MIACVALTNLETDMAQRPAPTARKAFTDLNANRAAPPVAAPDAETANAILARGKLVVQPGATVANPAVEPFVAETVVVEPVVVVPDTPPVLEAPVAETLKPAADPAPEPMINAGSPVVEPVVTETVVVEPVVAPAKAKKEKQPIPTSEPESSKGRGRPRLYPEDVVMSTIRVRASVDKAAVRAAYALKEAGQRSASANRVYVDWIELGHAISCAEDKNAAAQLARQFWLDAHPDDSASAGRAVE